MACTRELRSFRTRMHTMCTPAHSLVDVCNATTAHMVNAMHDPTISLKRYVGCDVWVVVRLLTHSCP